MKSVSSTKIFARAGENGRQFLVYSMSVEARKDLAMILPLPTRLPAGEHDAEFIDLKDYPVFFVDLNKVFPMYITMGLETSHSRSKAVAASPLEVVPVGNFEASFVPAMKDFERLDERFRIAPDVWKQLPGYEDYSFAVFKLKRGAMAVHPMAFSFPRRDTKNLFYPTVHIHDGKVHEKAEFDHTLYCQPRPDERLAVMGWEESFAPPGKFMLVEKTRGILLADQHCYKQNMNGLLANRDTFLSIRT